ncbi:hypothetical protein GLOIN_2v1472582 [Rhizophagus irregularis DAOM 181602=DAOM 197198]|nr:hypothetical protein GLOIN_2v1472582 [Rhizophagus irregularis DAOM 181602=DAOM 197198]
MNPVKFRYLRIFQIVITFLICLIDTSRIHSYERLNNFYIMIVITSLFSLAYNLFRAENPEFVKRSLRLVFNMYDNNLDSILLIFWFFAVIISTLTFFTSWNDMCYGFSVIRCMSHIIGYILCLIMFLSCVIRVDTKSEDNSQQNDEEETVPLLNDDVDAELIDDDEINVRCIKADKKETEVDVIDVDVELIDDDEIDVKCIEADKKETEVDEVDAKLIKIDNSEGQHEFPTLIFTL